MDFSYWIEVALYAGIIQGVFLFLFLPKISSVNKEANKILAMLLLLASVGTLLFLNTVFRSLWSVHVHAFLDTIPFLFAPLFFFYIQKLLFDIRITKKALFHFIPAFLHSLYALSSFRFSEEEFLKALMDKALINELGIIFVILSIWILAYWIFSVRLLIKFHKDKKEVHSFRQNFHYLSIFLGALLICYLLGITFSLDFFFGIKLFPFTGINLGWIVLPLLIYFISYYAFIQPESLRVSSLEKKQTASRLNEELFAEKKEMLEKVMQEEKLYLNPLLKLNDVAKKIQLDVTKLSWLINEGYEYNFYDFVNQYRIRAFIDKLNKQEHKKQTLLALAFEVGFNSKTTFNKSFKNKLGLTPSAYVKMLNEQNALSSIPRLAS